ncbi:hypothetical protein THAOC_28525, partial [Thalassiosira oceanica]
RDVPVHDERVRRRREAAAVHGPAGRLVRPLERVVRVQRRQGRVRPLSGVPALGARPPPVVPRGGRRQPELGGVPVPPPPAALGQPAQPLVLGRRQPVLVADQAQRGDGPNGVVGHAVGLGGVLVGTRRGCFAVVRTTVGPVAPSARPAVSLPQYVPVVDVASHGPRPPPVGRPPEPPLEVRVARRVDREPSLDVEAEDRVPGGHGPRREVVTGEDPDRLVSGDAGLDPPGSPRLTTIPGPVRAAVAGAAEEGQRAVQEQEAYPERRGVDGLRQDALQGAPGRRQAAVVLLGRTRRPVGQKRDVRGTPPGPRRRLVPPASATSPGSVSAGDAGLSALARRYAAVVSRRAGDDVRPRAPGPPELDWSPVELRGRGGDRPRPKVGPVHGIQAGSRNGLPAASSVLAVVRRAEEGPEHGRPRLEEARGGRPVPAVRVGASDPPRRGGSRRRRSPDVGAAGITLESRRSVAPPVRVRREAGPVRLLLPRCPVLDPRFRSSDRRRASLRGRGPAGRVLPQGRPPGPCSARIPRPRRPVRDAPIPGCRRSASAPLPCFLPRRPGDWGRPSRFGGGDTVPRFCGISPSPEAFPALPSAPFPFRLSRLSDPWTRYRSLVFGCAVSRSGPVD